MQALAGKPFATIGFGQKQYPRFCAAAEMFMQLASDAKVKNLQPVGKCNGDGNEEADFRLWVSDLLAKYAQEGLLKEDKLAELQAPLALDKGETTVRPPALRLAPAQAQLTCALSADRERQCRSCFTT